MVGDQQRIAIRLLEDIFQEDGQNISYDWLINKHRKTHFGSLYGVIDNIFLSLGGDREGMLKKREKRLSPDCYFGGKFNFLFEYDELQHFTQYKILALLRYPKNIEYNFNVKTYIDYCKIYSNAALRKGPPGYRKSKMDFPFKYGRAAQRAYLDAFRDLLPPKNDLNPTLRIPEFEVGFILANDNKSKEKLIRILNERKIIN